MNKDKTIGDTKKFIKEKFLYEGSGHDWWHTYRVWKLSKNIAKKEKVDLFATELIALLHDVADWKFNEDQRLGEKTAEEWLIKQDVDTNVIKKVKESIEDISFKGAKVKTKTRSKECEIVQDADRLDAIGAIGIARTFATGATRGRVLFNPEISTKKSVLDFRNGKDSYSSIHHFYDKILRLKDLMNTKTAKRIAIKRHKFVERYLKEFFNEWEGID